MIDCEGAFGRCGYVADQICKQVVIHLLTIGLLREWARWGEAQNISYPSMSPMFGERALKMPLFGSGHIPADVWQVEQAVCKIEWEYRHVLILRYQRHLTFGHICKQVGLSNQNRKCAC